MFDDPDNHLYADTSSERRTDADWVGRLIMLVFLVALIVVMLLLRSAQAEPLKPFTTDGCSGGMSASYKLITGKPTPWESCCVDHDRSYWQGGTADDRKRADHTLYLCVKAKGYPAVAAAMWAAVRPGGVPFMPFDWRWGYGRDLGTSYWYDRPGLTGN